MRSITTVDPRTPVAISMPGRYKSCRRSPSELFTKEQEQELQQCALKGIEDSMKAEQQDEAKEKETPVTSIEVNPPKLTPLRWRSTSMKELSAGHEVAGSVQPAEDSTEIPPGSSAQPAKEVKQPQLAKRPSQAQLRAQVMNSLSLEKVHDSAKQEERVVNHAQAGEPGILPVEREHAQEKEGSPSSAKPVESTNISVRTELFPENPAASNGGKIVRPEEQVKAAADRREVVSGNGTNGVTMKPERSLPVVPIDVDLPEEIVFQPVDLDQKYREKELVRHFTAAKIQNREEALLNNPGSPALSGRKGPVGEEPAAMTIEFLRARLQAERSASKTVKLKMESLSKKVVDLEGRLLAEIELRKSAEAALQDALTKLKVAVPQGSPTPASTPQKVSDTVPKDTTKTVQRGDLESKADLVPLQSVPSSETKLSTGIPSKDMKEPGSAKDINEDGAAIEDRDEVSIAGLWRDRSVAPHPSVSVQGIGVNGGEKESASKLSQDSTPERALSPSKQKEEKRAVIEERLRSMWAQIGEDMAALAEARGDQDSSLKSPMGWVGQLPNVLQEKQSPGEMGRSANGQQVDSSEGDSEQTETVLANGKPKQDQASKKASAMAEKRTNLKRNASLAKNVAKLVEQYELQETAQREWEENFEAQQTLGHNEGEPPALVTPDGDVVTERVSGPSAPGGMTRSQSQGERDPNVHGERISRSKSMGFLPSQQGVTAGRTVSRKASSNGRIEILDDSPIGGSGGDPEELLFDPETEVAEELPNGIYLHHSREEVGSSYKRGSKDAMYRRSTERVGVASNGTHSPRRGAHHSRERFPRADSHGGEMDQQGWPVREVQERASRDMYYDPVINNSRGGARVDIPHSNSDRDFHHRSKPMPERVTDDMHRNGHWRDAPGMDRISRAEDTRRVPASHYEEAPGMPYGYHRDHPEQDLPYRAAGSYRQREDGHRGMPGGWQDGGDPGVRSRGTSHPSYGYPPTYGVEEPQQSPYVQPGLYADTGSYSNRRDVPYMSHGAQNSRPDYYSYGGGISGPRPPLNGYVPPDRQAPASQGGYAGWDSNGGQEDRSAPVGGTSEDAVPAGEAGEVLKALRIAKQQIKNSTGEQAAFMTAQYTVSQEHRYGAGGQVSKTSYTVEAPVGWHLEGGKSSTKRHNGLNGSNGVIDLDLTGANVTELISGAGPLTVTGGESSYVEKLNVGRGIQFFFSS